jgi:hypothetical protein
MGMEATVVGMISRLALEINQNSDNSKGAGSWDAGFHFLTDIP